MNCDQSTYMAPNTSKLKIYIESKHKSISYKCDQCNFQFLKNINHKGTLNPNMKVFAITVLTVVIKLCVNVILRIISKLNMREFVIVVINVITKHHTHKS